MALIQVDDVQRTFHMGEVDVHALRGVSLAIERGEFVAIMGASGSGKSTLMNILGCLDRPTEGEYVLEGVDVAGLDEPALARVRGRRIGFVFQTFNLLARTSALENVVLPLFYRGNVSGNTTVARSVLASLGLADREQNHPNQLSGGQQQRVAIARALVGKAPVIMADEPTGNLDTRTSYEVMAILQGLVAQGKTVILVTHESDIAAYASRVVTLRDGLIIDDKQQTPIKAEVAA